MKKTALLFTAYLLCSCASIHETLVDITAIEKNIERVDIEQDQYKRPQFYVGNFKFSNPGRKIASVENSVNQELSNRQLYFLSFYQQYLILGKLLGQENTITSCPSFHNVILNHQDKFDLKTSQYTTNLNLKPVKDDQTLVVANPVMALPYTSKMDLYTYLLGQKWEDSTEHLQKALINYYEIEKQEVAVLCDRGVSPGYYVYENLVNYFKGDQSFHRSKDGLKALLKVPVIANMLILDNLRLETYPNIKVPNQFESWLMERSNLSWFGEYRKSIGPGKSQELSAKY